MFAVLLVVAAALAGGTGPAMLVAAALQAAHLIDVLSDLRSIDAHEIELDFRQADLRHAVETAVDQMDVLAQGHTLRYSGPAAPVVADFDQHRIQRVLQNVIGNAI